MFNQRLLNLMARFMYKNKQSWRGGSPQCVYGNDVAPPARLCQSAAGPRWLSRPCSLCSCRGQLPCPPRLLKSHRQRRLLWWRPLVRCEDGLCQCSAESTQQVYRKRKANKARITSENSFDMPLFASYTVVGNRGRRRCGFPRQLLPEHAH